MKHFITPNNRFKSVFSILIAVFFWQLMSMVIGEELFLPSPIRVLFTLFEMMKAQSFYLTIFVSLKKILAGFFLAVIIGFFLAVAAFHYESAKTLIEPYITVAKTVPVASFVLLSLLWLNIDNLPTFIIFLVNLPIIYANSLGGLQSADRKLIELADVYMMRFFKRMRYIFLPGMKRQFLTGISLASGVAWKSGVAAEVIGLPKETIGRALYYSKVYLETAELFAWTLVILVLSWVFERSVLLFFETVFERMER